MKRKNWIGSISDAVGHPHALSPGVQEALTRIDALLFEAWNLGGNIMLAWTREGRELRFLAVRHYKILEPFASDSSDSDAHADRQLINTTLAGPKFIEPGVFQRLCLALGKAARVIHTRLEAREEPPTDMVSGLVTRYGVTLVRERAVILLDAVGFSLHSPLEQVAMLNSLSYSVNSACRQLASRDIHLNFARSTTGDGFYIWDRSPTPDGNIALYKLLMLLLTDNAIAQRKARRFPVPSLRAAFHVGEHYEFFQVEALSPTTFSYIVGQVTIELARILEKALPGQILVGDFRAAMNDGGPAAVSAPEFIERTASMLGALQGLGVANDRIAEFRCYLTGQSLPDGSYGIDRFEIRDKHGLTRSVFNAKINVHLQGGAPIFLGLQNKALRPALGAPVWP